MNLPIVKRISSIIRASCIVTALFGFAPGPLFAAPTTQFIVLHSYSQEYPWTRGQHEGFLQAIAEDAQVDAVVSTEYMDTKRRAYDEAYASDLARHLQMKYKGYKPAAIYVTDDNALLFARDHLSRVFPNTPVFFSGINDFGVRNSLDSSLFTGVFERQEVAPNLAWLQRMDKDVNDLIFIGDGSNTYQAIENEARHDLIPYRLRATFIAEKRLDHALARLHDLPGKYLFLTTLGGITDADGKVLPLRDTIKSLTLAGRIVISMEDSNIIEGVLGGYVTSGHKQGINAAHLLLAYLHGKPIADLPPILKSPNALIFDDRVLQKFGINLPGNLRSQAILLNPHPVFYEQNRSLILGSLIGLTVLFFLVVTGSVVILARKNRELSLAKDALWETQQRFQGLVETLYDWAWEVDPQGHYTYVSPRSKDILGYEPEELIGKTPFDLMPTEEVQRTLETFSAAIAERKPIIALENINRHKDGHTIVLETNGLPFYDSEGNFQGYRGTDRNITERMQTEKGLREANQKLKLHFEQTPMAVIEWDLDFRVTRWNPAAQTIFGFSTEEAIGTHSSFIVPETFHPHVDQMWKDFLKTGGGERSTNQNTRKDGMTIFCEWYNTPLVDERGKVTGVASLVHDITERKGAEEKLIESEKRLKREQALNSAIIDSIPGTFYMLDESGRYARWNSYQRDEIVGKPDDLMTVTNAADTIHPDDRALIGDRIASVLGNGVEEPVEGRVLLRGGPAFRWLLMTGRQMKIDGRPFLVGIGIDITEHKRMEEETKRLEERLQRSEKMESLGTLAGGVAHDLNNVLGIIVGYSELILDSVDESSPIKSHLVNIMNGGQKAAAIVDDLLTLARRGVQGRSIVNLNKIVAECQKSPEFANLSFHHPAVKIIADLETDLRNISGSSVHLGKSLYNLISNASEAMPKGGTVAIKTTSQYLDTPIQGYDQVRGGDYVVLSVSDTGEGIPDADLKRIFEPFYTKKVMGRSGTGLGLAVVWGTVKDHNGYINVQSEEGKGSTFTLYFPVTREDITAEYIAASISEYLGKGESILVVDDVKEQRDLAASLLSKLNYSVTSVSSGEEAVAYLKEHEVDLMVLDMIMDPGMDGLDTYKSILEIRPNQKAIIVSGFSESDRVKTAEGLGVGAYVRKPYIKEKLGVAVRKELDRSA